MMNQTRYWIGLLLLAFMLAPATAAQQDGDGTVTVTGELKQWHKVTLTIDGPFARETDTNPNPFVSYNLLATFTHESGSPSYIVPGYFAADGNAAETSATQGTKWRLHFSPNKAGRWSCEYTMLRGTGVALSAPSSLLAGHRADDLDAIDASVVRVGGQKVRGRVSIDIQPTDKTGRDLRAHGRLEYVGKRYLRFAGSGEYFLKAGADAPETLLAYKDFDGTVANNPKKGPLKTYEPHRRDWQQGDPTWQGGKGKGLIGAINYLSSTGCNAFSFLPYNAGGDGDNVWPFIERDKKMHYDCSKLDQWQVVFDHATTRGMYLHFKLQETENDDNRNKNKPVPTALDGGDLGPERKLYLRELIARYGYLLALNWNLGEENTQSTRQQRDMSEYIKAVDPYDHHIVLHTYPNQQEKVFTPLLADGSVLTGLSLQNSNVRDCHWQTLQWVQRSTQAGKPWVVAFDEPGDASFGEPPDPDYPGVAEVKGVSLTIHDVRKSALWGTLMAGGGGVEYYFGYKLPQNDLLCEDWRSRDQSWKYCDIALSFFRDHDIPFWEMDCRDDLIGADPKKNTGYCLAKPGELYLVYLPKGGSAELDLGKDESAYDVRWFNPRTGGELVAGSAKQVKGGGKVSIGSVPDSNQNDWLAVIRKRK